MRTDLKPSDGIAIENSDGSVANADTGRVHGRNIIYSLEMKTGMSRILVKKPICLPRLMLNVAG
jgi:hypothetical protein